MSGKIFIKNIKQIVQFDNNLTNAKKGAKMSELPTLENAFIAIENGIIADVGLMSDWPGISDWRDLEVIDASNKLVLPAYCDSHTHLVFAGPRDGEFVDRINGLSYEEIAEKGGGILNSAKKLASKSEDELYTDAMARLDDLIKNGTGAIEIKSGYGLSVEAEIKILRVAQRIKENTDATVKVTFLGAHAYPKEYKEDKAGYVDLIINEMLPIIGKEKLADYIDVFCEKGYFSVEDTDRILIAGAKYGLKPKIHVNQFNAFGGVQIGIKHNAVSVDHLEEMREEDIEALKTSSTIPTALPSCSFFLGIPYAPAKKMIAEDLPLALASDYNPGSTPSGNMNFVTSLACIKMKLTPEQAFNAVTINGAAAMECQNQLGSITIGKKANLFVTKEIPGYNFIPYSFGSNCVETVILNGRTQN